MNSIDFEVEILKQAKDIFYKEHYPSMKIESGNKTVIKGFYNPGEEEFLADYFMRYGNYVMSVKPESLKQIIQDRVENLLNHYQKLLIRNLTITKLLRKVQLDILVISRIL